MNIDTLIDSDLQNQTKQLNILNNLTNNMYCPISRQLFKDPVIAADGFTYERELITKWFEMHNTSPLTNAQININILIPNLTIKSFIKDFLELEKINDSIKPIKSNNPIKSQFFINSFIITKDTINLQNNKLIKLINNYGFDYVDPTGKSLLVSILKSNKDFGIVNYIVSFHINGNLLEKEYVHNDGKKIKLTHMICCFCSERFVRKLTFAGCDINTLDSQNWAPVHYACLGGNLDTIMYLAKTKINMNIITAEGFTPFHVVCKYGNLSAIKCVALKSENINTITNENMTYKDFLKINKHLAPYDIKTIELFLKDNKLI